MNGKPQYIKCRMTKKSGGYREIYIPDMNTKKAQREILNLFQEENISYLPCVMGFRKGMSIVENAKAHIGHKYLIHYDIVDFFDSITDKRLMAVLEKYAKNSVKHKNELGVVEQIVKWTTVHGHLIQGAPTSPLFSNLVCENMDNRFSKLANQIGASYTRYADDIVISGDRNILEYQTLFKRIIRTEKFRVNHRKTSISVLSPKRKYHKVTGLLVGDKVLIDRQYIQRLQEEIVSYNAIPQDESTLRRILGKISFVQMLAPRRANQLRNLLNYVC